MGNAARRITIPKSPAKDTDEDSRIVLKGPLSSGGFGSVYCGECTGSNQKVAIKYIRKREKDDKRLESGQQQREISILSKVHHPHIVELFSAGETKQGYYIVTELLEGGDLHKRIKEKGPLSEKDAASVLRQLASALDYLHKLGIVHRDVKPQNICFTSPKDYSCVKLLDFGLAAEIGPGQRLRRICGTPGYLAPEVGRSRGYDARVDNWSLGVILFAMLTGQLPFRESKTTEKRPRRRSQYKLEENRLYRISSLGRDLLRSLLEVDVEKRLTTTQILAHPWFKAPREFKLSPSTSPSPRSVSPSASPVSSPTSSPIGAVILPDVPDRELPSPPRAQYRRLQSPVSARAAGKNRSRLSVEGPMSS